MASNTYVVRLIDCEKAVSGPGGIGKNANQVLAKLKNSYTSLCQQASSADTNWTADVQWLEQPPRNVPGQDAGNPLTINMLLFFVPSARESVIKRHPNYKNKDVAALGFGDAGLTVTGGQTVGGVPKMLYGISEIYIANCKGTDGDETTRNLAATAFHESMHNQLAMGNEMHQGATGFRAAVPTGDSPDANNLRDMAAKIGTLIPQWLDGFQAWMSWATSPLPD
jgi:hypothetical protein